MYPLLLTIKGFRMSLQKKKIGKKIPFLLFHFAWTAAASNGKEKVKRNRCSFESHWDVPVKGPVEGEFQRFLSSLARILSATNELRIHPNARALIILTPDTLDCLTLPLVIAVPNWAAFTLNTIPLPYSKQTHLHDDRPIWCYLYPNHDIFA